MAVSVRMPPVLEQELEQAAKRQGVSKSQFIIDAVERALGRKDPAQLLLQVREEFAAYDVQTPDRPEQDMNVPVSRKEKLRQMIRSKHEASLADWQAYHAERAASALQAKQAGESAGL